jgi:tetratricopeptide (TPR) repeat protein
MMDDHDIFSSKKKELSDRQINSIIIDVALSALKRQDEALADLLELCSVPHFVSAELIDVLKPYAHPTTRSGQQLMGELVTYPFVQKHSILGVALHEEVRSHLRARMHRENAATYRATNLALAQFFGACALTESTNALQRVYEVERVFHLCASDEVRGIEVCRTLYSESEQSGESATCSRLARVLEELYDTLSPTARMWLTIYEAKSLFLLEQWPESHEAFKLLSPHFPEMSLEMRITYLMGRGALERSQGDWESSIATYQRCLEMLETKDSRCPIVLNELGLLHYRRGAWERATELYRKSIEVSENINNVATAAEATHNLAKVRYRQGFWEEALAYTRLALRAFESIGNDFRLAWALLLEARIFRQMQQYDKVAEAAARSSEIFTRVGSQQGNSRALQMAGEASTLKGEYADAERYLLVSLDIKQRLGDKDGEEQALEALGVLRGQQGRVDEAIALLSQSLELSQNLGDAYYRAKILGDLARLEFARQHYDEAGRLFGSCLSLSRQVGDLRGEQGASEGLARIYAAWGQNSIALDHVTSAVNILERLSSQNPTASFLKLKIAELVQIVKGA